MAQSAQKKRTISYLRACWPEPIEVASTLQEALVDCLTLLPNATDAQLDLRDGRAEVRHRHASDARLCLHIAAWTDREAASTVPHVQGLEADLSFQPPGSDWDYLDGDGMMMISANHCLLMPSGLHPKSMEQYIRNLLELGRNEGAGISEEMDQFQLLPIARPAAVQQVCEQGVKKISLNVGQYMETARERDDYRHETIVERIGRGILSTLFTREEDRRRIERAENVSAQLVVKLDSRRPGLSPEDLAPIAQEIAEESEDDVVIETSKGQRFQRGNLVLKKVVDVAAFEKTVHHVHAWEIMAEYFRDLTNSGMLGE